MEDVVADCFDRYPEEARAKLLALRSMIVNIASDLELGEVEETLKWGEPSYSVKSGSPIRIDWKLKAPSQYCLYFNCQTTLIETFRELYSDVLAFQGNRAIVLCLSAPLPTEAVKHCITLGLTYQRVKHLPLLGA